MITVGMNYQVIPGKEQTFIDAFAAVLEKMKSMPGHSRSQLYRDVFEPQCFAIVSDWSDRAAFDAFIRSDAFRSVANWGKEQILAGRPTHTYYDRQG